MCVYSIHCILVYCILGFILYMYMWVYVSFSDVCEFVLYAGVYARVMCVIVGVMVYLVMWVCGSVICVCESVGVWKLDCVFDVDLRVLMCLSLY